MHGFRPAVPAEVAATLDPGRVHVWRLPYAPADRRQPFRSLCACYLRVPAERVAFRDDPGGRPALSAPPSDLCVNWSHSGGHAVFAVARALPMLGVDFEAARPRPRAMALARRFFHAEECRELAACPGDTREAAFLKLWTAKEAVLKALGEGLRFGLERVVFHVDEERVVPARFDEAAGPAREWSLQRLDDPIGYVSVAWHGPPRVIDWFSLAGEGEELSGPLPV